MDTAFLTNNTGNHYYIGNTDAVSITITITEVPDTTSGDITFSLWNTNGYESLAFQNISYNGPGTYTISVSISTTENWIGEGETLAFAMFETNGNQTPLRLTIDNITFNAELRTVSSTSSLLLANEMFLESISDARDDITVTQNGTIVTYSSNDKPISLSLSTDSTRTDWGVAGTLSRLPTISIDGSAYTQIPQGSPISMVGSSVSVGPTPFLVNSSVDNILTSVASNISSSDSRITWDGNIYDKTVSNIPSEIKVDFSTTTFTGTNSIFDYVVGNFGGGVNNVSDFYQIRKEAYLSAYSKDIIATTSMGHCKRTNKYF